jgi:hypothetical protein
MAAQWLERNYTFKYMERFRVLQIIANERVIQLPTNSIIKAFKFVRILNSDGSYSYLNKIEPEDSLGVVSDLNPLAMVPVSTNSGIVVPTPNVINPRAYWIVANKDIVLNAIPATDLVAEVMYYEYTSWPTALDSEEPLIDIASDVLIFQTLLFMSSLDTRDQRMAAAYKEFRDEGVNTLTRSEDENKYGSEQISMIFVPEVG